MRMEATRVEGAFMGPPGDQLSALAVPRRIKGSWGPMERALVGRWACRAARVRFSQPVVAP